MTRRTGYVKGVNLRQSAATRALPGRRKAEPQGRSVTDGGHRSRCAPGGDLRPTSPTSARRAAGLGVDARHVLVGLLEHLDRPATVRSTELMQYGGHMATHGHL